MASGLLCLDQPSMALLGVDPDTYDGRIETWISHVHPDDIAWVTAEVDKAISTRGAYQAEYRVCRPDGSNRWVLVRGQVEADADGNPFRMLGTAWDTTQARTTDDGLRSALRYMSDGFLSVDKDWRVIFANAEAERLLASQHDLTGRLLWDLLVIRRVPGLEARCREAAAGTTPTSFDVQWPDTGRWYRFRLVPVPDGLACYFTDITESRMRQSRAGSGRAHGGQARGPDPGSGLRPGRGRHLAGYRGRGCRPGTAAVRGLRADHPGNRGWPDAHGWGGRLLPGFPRPDQRPGARSHPGRGCAGPPPALVHLVSGRVQAALPGHGGPAGCMRQAGVGVPAAGRLRARGGLVRGLL